MCSPSPRFIAEGRWAPWPAGDLVAFFRARESCHGFGGAGGEEEKDQEFITSGNWRGKHNSLSRGAGADLPRRKVI
jgi:hypothetical protein